MLKLKTCHFVSKRNILEYLFNLFREKERVTGRERKRERGRERGREREREREIERERVDSLHK